MSKYNIIGHGEQKRILIYDTIPLNYSHYRVFISANDINDIKTWVFQAIKINNLIFNRASESSSAKITIFYRNLQYIKILNKLENGT